MADDKCGVCHYFETEACDLKPRKAKDQACGDFYRKRETKQSKPKPLIKASGIALEGPFEAIFHNGEPRFLVRTDNGFEIKETVTNPSKLVVPLDRKQFPYEPYGYQPGGIPTREELFWRVRDEFEWFLDCEPEHKDFLAACVLLTYQQEKLRTVPYAYFYGDNESGKTVALSILKMLCYRPLYGVTIPSADLYGYLDDSDCIGTILEDEAQGLDKTKDFDKTKIYKAGYKEGAVVPRFMMSQTMRYIRYYNTFCFKAVASEKLPQLKGLLERFIFISMVEGYPKKDWADINGEDLARIQKLRNDLLKWRLASRIEWQIPDVQLPIRGRIKELWKPILQVVHGLPIEETLRKRIDYLKNSRIKDKQRTLEGFIVKVVAEQVYEGKDVPIKFTDIWDALCLEMNGTKDDKKDYIFYTSELDRDRVTKNIVGYRLREVLDGKRITVRDKQTEANVKAYRFDEQKLKRIAKKYGYNLHTKLPTLPTSGGVKASVSTLENHEGKHDKEPKPTAQKLGELGNSVCNKLTDFNIIKCVWLDDPSVGKCANCKNTETLPYQMENTKKEYGFVCKRCGEFFTELIEKQRKVD